LPTSSFFFASTEMTGSPAAWKAAAGRDPKKGVRTA